MNVTTKKPKVSVIVNSFKDIVKLESCLYALKRDKYDNKEVIVVSYGIPNLNKSETVRMRSNQVIMVEKDFGPPYQRNVGFGKRDPNSKYVLFIDDDVLVTNLMIQSMVKLLEKNPEISIAQPLLVNPSGLIDCCGTFIDRIGYSYLIFSGKDITDFNCKRDFFEVSYAAGACMMLRVSYFLDDLSFQPFDSNFYFNYEDVDISLRSWIRGKKVICITSTKAIHKKRRTFKLKKSPSHLIYLNTRNKFITLMSVYSTSELIMYLPLFVGFELIKSVFMIKAKLQHSIKTIYALLWCLKNCKRIWSRRKLVQMKAMNSLGNSAIISTINLPLLNIYFKRHYDL